MDKNIVNEIKSFLESSDNDVKYLVNVETNPKTNLAHCFFKKPDQEDHSEEYIEFTPFIYIKDLTKFNIYNGDKELKYLKLKQYGIKIKKLETGTQERLENGYKFMVSSTISYNSIFDFFKDGGLNFFEKTYKNDKVVRDNNGKIVYKNRKYYFSVRLEEQFFISTGIRLFKGLNHYKDLHKLTFDIETTGLRYETCRIISIGIKDNRSEEIILKVLKDNDDEEEKRIIEEFFKVVKYIDPSIIIGYNSEDFDFHFILNRARILEMDITSFEVCKGENNVIIRKEKSTVKIGSSTEYFTATKIYGRTVLDVQHAAKRTQAINSDIKNTKLKYLCKFENIAKENRVYIQGDEGDIYKFYRENKIFCIDKINSEYEVIPDEYQVAAKSLYKIINEYAKSKISTDEYNLKKKEIYKLNSNFFNWLRKESVIKLENLTFISGSKLVDRYLIDDLWETEELDNLYNQSSFMLAKILPTTYQRVATMGNAGIWDLLMTSWSYSKGLAIPLPDESVEFPGGLARCFKKGLTKRLAKIDFASLYPMIQLTFDIFPVFDITGVMKKMLMYLTTSRNIYKKLANFDDLNENEIELLKSIDNEIYEKYITNQILPSERSMFKIKQLPIKIVNNSLFGALGSGVAFKWSDSTYSSRITCTGRILLRKVITYFSGFGCIPLLAVTDGVNFHIPDKTKIGVKDDKIFNLDEEILIEDAWKYGEFSGIKALIEKYNKEDVYGYTTIDNDGEFLSCFNLSRINYALLYETKDKKTGEVKEKIKLVGNTIKSKTMPEYIEEFIDTALDMILHGKGKEFINYYYDYVDKIYYNQIPLKKIASKSKVKQTIKEYLNRGTDKNGKLKAKQAHMELLIIKREEIARNLYKKLSEEMGNTYDESLSIDSIMSFVKDHMPPEPELDTVVYYYNTGTKKSHGDVKKDPKTNELILNADIIDNKELLNNPDMLGVYNSEKYLEAFNKRISDLFMAFDESISNDIMVKVINEKVNDVNGNKIIKRRLSKKIFTDDQLEIKNYDGDNLQEAMVLEDKEIDYWNNYGYNPKFVWDGFSTKKDYDLNPEPYQFAIDYLSKKMVENGKPKILSVNDKYKKGSYVLFKKPIKVNKDFGEIIEYRYDLSFFNGNYHQFLRFNIEVPKTKSEIDYENKMKQFYKEEREKKEIELQKHNEYIINKELKNEDSIKLFDDFKKIKNLPESLTYENYISFGQVAIDMLNEFKNNINGVVDLESDYYDIDEGDF